MYKNETPNTPQPRRPLRSRIPDVGHGLHELRQQHLLKMDTELTKKGIQPTFRVKKIEDVPQIETRFMKEITHKERHSRSAVVWTASLSFITRTANTSAMPCGI
ncbi:hypothetical protein [Paenibacillus hexagrammi]|uniref:Uncharacterized protein n=1 Tax=Paenibacillus hexagrammi TaxID=2908839 RepID=A0ABY3ST88_9BACL|nr:hypothetical protein [Paenibacillus sp. YPD9-1]UJF36585.1 hypothetical protein L0M14_30825 [Paenibacillus sp. YPD9-1]